MNHLKKSLLFLLLFSLLLYSGCAAGKESSALSASSGPAASSDPAGSLPESSGGEPVNSSEASAPVEAPTYYFDEAHGETLLAKITEEGTLLPDGRLVTSEGVVMPNGEVLYAEQAPFPYVQEDRTVPETVQTLPDGTRIVAATYYFNNDFCDCPVAKMVKSTTLLTNGNYVPCYNFLLPDGRCVIVGKGIMLPDGTMAYEDSSPFQFGSEKYPEPEAVMILPDGTRIVAVQYYFGGSYDESLLVHRSQKAEGVLILPDGRTLKEDGIFLADGTKLFSLDEIAPFHSEYEGTWEAVMMFPDGTRIINPYGANHVISSEPCPECGYIHSGPPSLK